MLLTLATFQPARSELKAIAWESILLPLHITITECPESHLGAQPLAGWSTEAAKER
jgi:hypothetical protein